VSETDTPTDAPQPVDAGTWLRMAREAAGLSIDAVSQQLKLAPRQVKALEDGNFAELPGRTFVRGFVRNYARLLRLDPEAVVAALPGTEAAPALEGPTIGSSSRPMGELPVAHHLRGPSWSRWLIPLLLAIVVIAAAVYEFMRPGDGNRITGKPAAKAVPVEPAAPAPAAGGTPLPNPVAAGPSMDPVRADEPPRPTEAPASAPSTASTAASAATSAPVATPAEAPAPPAAAAPAQPGPGEAVLVVRYRGPAWTQVKDAAGQTLLVTNGEPGGTQTVSGKPPLELVIGNASEATVTWRGQPFDLAPHVKANVARARLP
jgi:cytoskeleton protein RodZ